VLPTIINNMFEVIDEQENYIYVRKGVARNKSSFLCAVLESMKIDNNKITKFNSDEEIDEYVQEIRETLATRENVVLCKQEMYDFPDDDILNAIRDPNTYFDPKLFLNLMQVLYKCNIFLFSINGLTLPRYAYNYLRYNNKYPCILIYEHIGSECNRSIFPQNDIIIKWKITDPNDQTYKFSQESITYKSIDRIFTDISRSYSIIQNNIPSLIDISTFLSKSPILSQTLDSYGKTRMFKTRFDDKVFTVFTNPLPPLHTKIEHIEIIKLDLNTAFRYIEHIGMTLLYKHGDRDNLKINEISGKLDNIIITIPLIDDININDIRLEKLILKQTSVCSFNHESFLQKYNLNNKIARCISDYTLWLYSKYINDTGIDMNDNTINLFIQERTKIIPNFDYTTNEISKRFTMSNKFIQNNKIICTSQKMVNKLKYLLKLEMLRNTDLLKQFHTKKYIDSFYINVSDFEYRSNQIILLGQDALENYIKNSFKNDKYLVDTIQQNLT